MDKIKRLAVTKQALDLIDSLNEKFGDLMFYQAGGCCEGTQPQCFEKGSFFPRTKDVCIGQIKGFDFWLYGGFKWWEIRARWEEWCLSRHLRRCVHNKRRLPGS